MILKVNKASSFVIGLAHLYKASIFSENYKTAKKIKYISKVFIDFLE
jgi:hypothetical protein